MRIEVPEWIQDHVVIASVSGGKDSTALLLALREAGVAFRAVFADTGWEHPAVYAYLDYLRVALDIAIDVVSAAKGGMVPHILHRACFPSRMQRWCTRELKLEPLRAYHDAVIDTLGQDTCSAVGIRHQESKARAQMPILAFDDQWNGLVWRPLAHWGVADVLALHNRHAIKVNPLYQLGHDRVGCWPCIYANKEEIRLLGLHDPARVALIAELEQQCVALRQARNAEHLLAAQAAPGFDAATYQPRYRFPNEATFFQAKTLHKVVNAASPTGFSRTGTPMAIQEVIDWANCARGGRQQVLFAPSPTGGCMRWGLCDLAAEPLSAPVATGRHPEAP